MTLFTLNELAQSCDAELVAENIDTSATCVQGVSTDSRTLEINDLYIALTGERFDGHQFLPAAKERGAIGAVVSNLGEAPESLALLKVANTQVAFGRIAARNRKAFTGRVIALTGSSGKTTCKEMIASIMSECGNVLATAGNFNNEVGVPKTLLRLSPEHEFAVIEMGAAKSGDIAYLCEFVQPDVALLTNAQPAHVEGFGSLQGVANTKGEIFTELSDSGIAIVNRDDTFYSQWKSMIGSRQSYSFGFSEHADFRAVNIVGQRFVLESPLGSVQVTLNTPGKHMVANALAAAASCFAAGATLPQIALGLSKVEATPGRLHSRVFGGCELIDDTYNANPGSVKAAIDVLAEKGGHTVLVLGDMAELGSEAASLHQEVGAHARDRISHLYATGRYAQSVVDGFGAGLAFSDKQTLESALRAAIEGNLFTTQTTFLVKGSRSARMETIVEFISELLRGVAQS